MREKPEDEHAALPGEFPVAFETTALSHVIPAGNVWLTLTLSTVTAPLLVRANVAFTLPCAMAWDVMFAVSLNSINGSSSVEWDRTTVAGLDTRVPVVPSGAVQPRANVWLRLRSAMPVTGRDMLTFQTAPGIRVGFVKFRTLRLSAGSLPVFVTVTTYFPGFPNDDPDKMLLAACTDIAGPAALVRTSSWFVVVLGDDREVPDVVRVGRRGGGDDQVLARG